MYTKEDLKSCKVSLKLEDHIQDLWMLKTILKDCFPHSPLPYGNANYYKALTINSLTWDSSMSCGAQEYITVKQFYKDNYMTEEEQKIIVPRELIEKVLACNDVTWINKMKAAVDPWTSVTTKKFIRESYAALCQEGKGILRIYFTLSILESDEFAIPKDLYNSKNSMDTHLLAFCNKVFNESYAITLVSHSEAKEVAHPEWSYRGLILSKNYDWKIMHTIRGTILVPTKK